MNLPFIGQSEEEFRIFLGELERVYIHSFLEIGSLNGGVLARVRQMFPFVNIVSIDPAPQITYPLEHFHQVVGASQDNESRSKAWAYNGNKHFDAIFIDGDHNYEMVKQDWLWCKEAAKKLVAFHDIHHTWDERISVWRLWDELKVDPNLKTVSILGHGNDPTGIGIVYL